jgi:hypothetical protein
MSLKQFLKPDLRKLLILVFINFIAFYLFLGSFSPSNRKPTDIEEISGFLSSFFIWPLVIFDFHVLSGGLLILWTYIISCFIVWIYDKIKVKKK